MSRKLASIVEIESCEPIPDTDRLSVAMMKGKGWRVVTGRDEFKPGALAVFFEIDALMDASDPRYEFLRDRCLRKFVSKGGNVLREGIRIKTCKLRGVVSQGLLMPIGKFPELNPLLNELCPPHEDCYQKLFFGHDGHSYVETYEESVRDDGKLRLLGLVPAKVFGWDKRLDPFAALVDADVTELLHVEHYDEVKEQLQPQTGNPMSADAMGSFPTAYIPKTDEERLANLTDWFDTMKGRKFQISVKADGTSCTVAYSPSVDAENPFIVCSRNLRLKRETAAGAVPVYWQMAEKYKLLEKLESCYDHGGFEYAIQGEVVGPGINGDRNKEKEHCFKCFQIWDILAQKFIGPNETVDLCNDMGIPHVEVVETDFPFFDRFHDYDEAMEFAQGKTAEGNEREGVVLKSSDDGPFQSCKIVSNKYLMKQED